MPQTYAVHFVQYDDEPSYTPGFGVLAYAIGALGKHPGRVITVVRDWNTNVEISRTVSHQQVKPVTP